MDNITNKIRIDWIDLAKGISIILIIFAHNLEWYSSGTGYKTGVLPIIYSFHVPIFFFCSGFLFKVKDNFLVFLKKRAKSMLLPYFTFSVCFVIFNFIKIYIFKSQDDVNIIETIISLATQNHYNVLWFILVLFFVEIVAYFVVKTVNSNHKFTGIWLVMSFAIAILYYYLIYRNLIFSLDEVIYALPFFLCGYTIKNYEEKVIRIILAPIYIALSLVLTFVNLHISDGLMYVNMFKVQLGNVFLFYTSALLMILGVLSVLRKINIVKPLNYLGKNSLVYFGLHMILLQMLFHFLIQRFDGTILKYYMITIGATIVIIGILTLVNELFTKTPMSFLLGKKYKKEMEK